MSAYLRISWYLCKIKLKMRSLPVCVHFVPLGGEKKKKSSPISERTNYTTEGKHPHKFILCKCLLSELGTGDLNKSSWRVQVF